VSEKIRNTTGRGYCAACGNDGWVELAGTVTVGRTIYSRGMAPCKWCEMGDRRFQHHSAPRSGHGRYEPETNFTGSDIVPVGHEHPGRPFRPDVKFLQRHRWVKNDELAAKLSPGEVVEALEPITVDEAEVREKVLRARMALNEQFAAGPDTQEPISAPRETGQVIPPAENEEIPY